MMIVRVIRAQHELGTGQIDVFGTVNDSVTFKNFTNSGNQNAVVLHPGGVFNLSAPAGVIADRF